MGACEPKGGGGIAEGLIALLTVVQKSLMNGVRQWRECSGERWTMKRETQTVEFKQSWHDEYLKWICGFANAQGGKLTIGNPVGTVNVLDRRTK